MHNFTKCTHNSLILFIGLICCDAFSKNKKIIYIFLKSESYSVFFSPRFYFMILSFVPFDVRDPYGSIMFCGTLVLWFLFCSILLAITDSYKCQLGHAVYIKRIITWLGLLEKVREGGREVEWVGRGGSWETGWVGRSVRFTVSLQKLWHLASLHLGNRGTAH